jgi:ketosteroid isomerase-like protein
VKKRVALALLVVVVLVAAARLSSTLAQQQSSAKSIVTSLMQKHNQAFANRDLNGVMATWSSDPNVVIVGTGPGEYYVGRDSIRNAYANFFKKFKPGSMKVEYYQPVTGANADSAWFSAMSKVEMNTGNGVKDRGINWSGTMQKQNGKWGLVVLHFSSLMPGEAQAGK